MKLSKYISLIIASVLLISCTNPKYNSIIELVDPFIGTGFHGHTYPGATSPFGGVQLSPDTRTENWDACSGYHYSDSTILGFSHTHLSGTGCVDLGDILIRPTVHPINLNGEYIFSPTKFSHKNEIAKPGYYSVELEDEKVKAELTTSPHCGIHKYTFKNTDNASLIFDLQFSLAKDEVYEAYIKQTSPTTLEGMRKTNGWVDNQYVYFVAELSRPISKIDFVSDKEILQNVNEANGKDIQAVLHFDKASESPITVNVGISIVSIDNAKDNLKQEVGQKTFEDIYKETNDSWEKELSKIEVSSNNINDLKIFYTSLYHTMVVPNQISDVNGEYRRTDNTIGKVEDGKIQYSTLSVWDIYRAWSPLMTLIDTNLVVNIINSSLNFYDTYGELPIWPLSSGETGTMIGYHTVSLISDAYLKGIRGFDTHKALEAMVASSLKNKKGADYYEKLGFIPSNIRSESVSCLLEFAYDDWCIARMAEAMNEEEIANKYYNRSLNYINVFDGGTKFFRGKRSDGNWEDSFDPFKVSRNLTEANSWQYRFAEVQDINGMIQEFGGKENFVSALDSLFIIDSSLMDEDIPDITGLIGQYAHGNEPSHHVPYIYNFIGEGWKTQEKVRQILTEMYSESPEGICGNEDCGQMSAWYILSSIGLYQICPGSNEFLLTTPFFDEITLNLANGKTLKIRANNHKKNIYIQNVTLNGQDVQNTYLTYEQIMEGGELVFDLGNKPNYNWGTNSDCLPMSQTKTPRVAMPYVDQDLYLFENPISVEIKCLTKNSQIRYTLDGSEPTVDSELYTAPIEIANTTTIKAKAFCEGMEPSKTFEIKAEKAIPLAASKVIPQNQGVKVKYFEGEFHHTSDLLKAKEKSAYIAEYTDISMAKIDDHFGFIFSGYINVPEDGKYIFETKSDDGSVLYIDNLKVVDNDGSHAAVPATGAIVLKKGFHQYQLLYFEDYEGQALSWSWKTPSNDSLKQIPKNVLYY